MRIEIEGIDNITIKERIRKMIKDGEVLTWKFVTEENHSRLMHTGDKQYEDVVLKFLTKEGENNVTIEPKVRDGVKDTDTAKNHFGVVMGRFAELLNCHFADIKTYKTII